MNSLIWQTTEEIDLEIAQRLRKIRKRKALSQESLALKSGVSLGSIKRFENTGEISLKSLTKIATALECVNDLQNIFADVAYRNIEEVVNESRK